MFETEGKEIKLSVPVDVEQETVWLNKNQMADLFDRDVKTIGKHINNALKEELDVYDNQNMERPKGNEASYVLTYEECTKEDHTLVALTIMIAEPKPDEMEMMITVIMNCMRRCFKSA